MSFYNVQVHAEGIRVPQLDGSAPVVGFYAIRIVWARSQDEAKEKALRLVRDLWTTGSYSQSNTGSPPALSVESVNPVGVMSWLRTSNKGHIFYPEEVHEV